MDISWTKQAGDGNAAIGSERDTLISLVNDVKRMIESKNSSALSVAFELLDVWLAAHFKDEEKKAHAAHIDFSSRKFEQQYELNELGFLRDGLAAKNGIWSDAEARLDIQFLSNWLIEHITNEDLRKNQTQTGNAQHAACANNEMYSQGA
jgi:hemerythrin